MESTTLNGKCASKCVKKKFEVIKDSVNEEDVEIIVKSAFGSRTKLIDYQFKSFSEGKIGFMGAHETLVVNIQRETSSAKEKMSFFVKRIPYEIEEQASLIAETKLFFKETNFYRHIVPELIKSSNDKSWIAQCYLVQDSLLVFEDLKLKNFKIRDKLLEITSLKSATAALAKLHAASILAEKRLGKTFHELYPEMTRETFFVRNGRFSDLRLTGIEVMVSVAKSLGLDFTCVPNVINRIFEVLTISKKWRNVLNHGDPWSFNMMFDDLQPQPNCVLVDFQIVRYLPASSDLSQLFYLTMTREFREKNERELLRYYNEVLSKTLRESGENIIIPKFEETLEEYEDLRIIGVVSAALYYPVILIDGMKSAEMTKDSDGFANLLYKKRDHVVLKMMQEDPVYKERIMEVATELVQRSSQLLL